MSLRARQNGGGKIRQGGGRGNGNGSPGGRGNNSGPQETLVTWDPANKGNGTVLSNSNKTCDLLGYQDWALSTTAHSTGKKYFEIKIVSWAAFSQFSFGIAQSTQNPENTTYTSNGSALRPQTAGWTSALSPVVNGSAAAAGDVLGFAVDFDAKTVQVYINNAATGGSGTMVAPFPASWKIAALQTWNNNLSAVLDLRTITADFTYSPPSGYTSWGTA